MAQDNEIPDKYRFMPFVRSFPLDHPYSPASYGKFFEDAYKARRKRGDFIEFFCSGLAYQPKRQLALLLACIWAQMQPDPKAWSWDMQRLQEAADAALQLMQQEEVASDPNTLMALLVEYRGTFWVQDEQEEVKKVSVEDIDYVAGAFLDVLLRRSSQPTF